MTPKFYYSNILYKERCGDLINCTRLISLNNRYDLDDLSLHKIDAALNDFLIRDCFQNFHYYCIYYTL